MIHVVSDGLTKARLAFIALLLCICLPARSADSISIELLNVDQQQRQTSYCGPDQRPDIPVKAYLVQMARKVRYELSRPRLGKEALIELVFKWDRKRVRISTREHVLPDHWDKTNCRVADRYVDVEPEYLEINRILDELNDLVRKNYNRYRRDLRTDDFTPAVVKDIVRTRLLGAAKDKDNAPTVAQYYQQYINGRINAGVVTDNTIKGERSTMKLFCAFDAAQASPAKFSDANLQLFERFRDYQWATGSSVDSSIYKNLRRFRQMLLHADAAGMTMGGNIAAISLQSQLNLSSKAMDTIALTEDDLRTLADLPLRGKEHLQRVRDLFLCGCYTGLRVNQWDEINQDNVTHADGVAMLQLFTTKGRRKSVTIPLHPVLLDIFERHDWQMPAVPKQHRINAYLKELCQVAGFTDRIELARNIRGRSILQTFERWELVTSHTARRSFATNAHAAGIPVDDIRAMTGQSLKVLLHYIKEDGQQRAARIGQSEWFKNS